jgi:hypothetical protein
MTPGIGLCGRCVQSLSKICHMLSTGLDSPLNQLSKLDKRAYRHLIRIQKTIVNCGRYTVLKSSTIFPSTHIINTDTPCRVEVDDEVT